MMFAACAAFPAAVEAREQPCEAVRLFESGRYAEAEAAFSSFIADHPYAASREEARMGVADCLYARGMYAKALRAYAKVDPSGLTTARKADYWYRTGVSALEAGDAARAEAAFTEASRYAAVRQEALFYLGRIAYDKADYARAADCFAKVNTTHAPGNLAPVYLAAIDYARGNYAKALSQARAVLRRGGLPAAAVAELDRIAGESLYRTGKNAEAVKYLRKYVGAVSEPMPSALYILGVDAFAAGDYKEALGYFRPVTERGTGVLRQSGYLFAGQCLLNTGDDAAAALAFNKAAATSEDPAVTEAAFYNYAATRAHGEAVPFASSAGVFEDFLRRYPKGVYSDRVASFLASGYIADNDYERAIERLRDVAEPSAEIQAAKVRVLLTLGLKALRDGDAAAAMRSFDEARAVRTGDTALDAEVTLARAEAFARQNDDRQAAALFRDYLRTAPVSAANRPVALYGLAYALYCSGDATGAEDNFRQAAQRLSAPEAQSDAYNRLADILAARADFEAAAAMYGKACDTNPSAADYAALNRARMRGFLRDYEGKLKALDSFERDFAGSVLMPDAMLERTEALISLGRNAEAVGVYRSLIDRWPRTVQGRRGYLQMAMTLLDMGRAAEADDAYRQVIRLYPTSEEAAQASAILRARYADEGRADEYFDFMATVDKAPQTTGDDAEELAYTSACNAMTRNGDVRQLERFAARYPQSSHTPQVLGMLLDDAVRRDDAVRAADFASKILDGYPDSAAASQALLYKAGVASAEGRLPEALDLYSRLAERASDASTATEARLGLMRTARDLGRYDKAGEAADLILASSAAPAAMSEARFTKAKALDAAGDSEGALKIWLDMAGTPAELYGAKSAFEAASALHEQGKDDRALKVAQKFVKSGSPQRYWVARGFILISDIYTAQGKDFEAREYLEALRDNYPGSEADIFLMIETRLEK